MITAGSFDFPESVLLAQLYEGALSARGYPVRVLPDLGFRQLAAVRTPGLTGPADWINTTGSTWHPAIGVAVVLLVIVSWTVVSVAGHG